MRNLLIACCVVLSAGCATKGSVQQAVQDRFLGHDIVTVIHRIGYPTKERTVVGRNVVTWERTTTYQGVTTDKSGHASLQPPVQLPCTIDMELDDLRKVIAVRLDGSAAACERFAN